MEIVWFCAPSDGGEGWVLDPGQTSGIAVLAVLYWRGSRRAGSHGVSVPWYRHLAFVAGVAMLLVALISPLHFASATSLTAHMIQHTLLLVAPLALIAAKAGPRVLQALPTRLRGPIARFVHPLVGSVNAITAVVILITLVVVWHLPPILEASTGHAGLHIAQHLTLVAAAGLYWAALFRNKRSYGLSLLSVFVLLLVGGGLGALLTFSTVALYPGYATRSVVAALDWRADQQLAGLVMWLPMGLILMAAGAWLAYRMVGGLKPGHPSVPIKETI